MRNVYVREEGEGNALLLIHGFPMHSGIWADVKSNLVSFLRVITVDLPGFGKSPLLSPSFSIVDVAKSVLDTLVQKRIDQMVVIGHSLGGYVALAMAEQRPDRVNGLGLLHSTALPDTQEKKQSRNKVIEFIEKNGAEAFTSNFITPLFAHPGHPKIGHVREMNMHAGAEALIGYVAAMRDRPDRTNVIKQFPKPILFIAGDKDPGISVESIREQALLSEYSQVEILANQAHMALVENPVITAGIIRSFVEDCFAR